MNDTDPEFSLDWPHGHQTRSGLPARVICSDRKGGRSLLVLVENRAGEEILFSCCLNGRVCLERGDSLDIINKPGPTRTHEVWCNFYPPNSLSTHPTKADADLWATPDRIARQKFTLIEGVFDE